MDFVLAAGSFTIMKTRKRHSKAQTMDFSFRTLSAVFLQRPASSKTTVTLSDLTLVDGITQGTTNPVLIRAKHHKASISSESLEQAQESSKMATASTIGATAPSNMPDDTFFRLVYENKPLSGRADNSVELMMKPLEVFFLRESVDALVAFFEPPQRDAAYDALLSVAENTLQAGLKGISK